MENQITQKDTPIVHVICKKDKITGKTHLYDVSTGKDVTKEIIFGPWAPIIYKIVP